MAMDENGLGLTDQEIRAEVDTFLFKGHDTTASALSWTIFSLAQHPKIQSQVQIEIDELLSGRMTDDLMASDLNELPYLTMCIKESLHLHSIISFITRHTEQDCKVLDKTIPNDTMTTILIYGLHHNPSIWEDSLEFRPERFSPENIDKINPFAYIPFSAGPRNCIGQNFAMHEIKVLLVKILNRFHLELDPNHDVKKFAGIVTRAENGIRMKAKLRIPRQCTHESD
ncbi:ultra-long-chain fatty acid omega-hydroxylase-like [Patella vulgata]|uniref:ultra-long-chain fatty acid omega-hydroxylase-like n=1 Tax=Patella vulgata TaxID=6465 RepID=UPI0024A7DB33|nr:ultra-long-chain fatty acid omega-hydroxylase-like [Patella vulgata]